MFKWCSNKKVGVFFDSVPCVGIRYLLPSAKEEEKKSIKKYPFINRRNLGVVLADLEKQKLYKFLINKGYCYDGASVPRLFWRVIGPNTDNRFLIPALVHDVLCENHDYVDNDRKFSSRVFDAMLEVSDVSPFKRFWMKNSVDVFQKLFCKWNTKPKKGEKC